jgi:hypothetical protein
MSTEALVDATLALTNLNGHPTIRSLQKCNGDQILRAPLRFE